MSSARPFIQFFPTLRCDRSCGFCFNRGMEEMPDAGADLVRALVRAARELGAREIDVLGGEPTLHPALGTFVDMMLDAGLELTMSTNGGRPDALDALLERHPTGLRVGVSVSDDAIGPALESFIERRRPWLKSLARPGGELPRALGGYLGREGYSYFHIYPDALSTADLCYTVPYPLFRTRLAGLAGTCGDIHGVSCGFEGGGEGGGRCPAGSGKVAVLPDGSVYPCYLLARHRTFLIGNLLTDNPSNILSSPAAAFFRRPAPNPCGEKKCPLHARCGGGCPAVSLLVSGDIAAADPRCAGGATKGRFEV